MLRLFIGLWVALAFAMPASASLLLTSGAQSSLTIGAFTITNTGCVQSSGSPTATCSNVTWGVDPNSLGYAGIGGVAITITPSASWNSSVLSDLTTTWTITANGGAKLNGLGTAVTGAGTFHGNAAQVDGVGPITNGTTTLCSTCLTAPYVSTDPSAPTNMISFSPQSVVYFTWDVSPAGSSSGNTVTSASIYVSRVPEPEFFGLALLGGFLAWAGRRGLRRDKPKMAL